MLYVVYFPFRTTMAIANACLALPMPCCGSEESLNQAAVEASPLLMDHPAKSRGLPMGLVYVTIPMGVSLDCFYVTRIYGAPIRAFYVTTEHNMNGT